MANLMLSWQWPDDVAPRFVNDLHAGHSTVQTQSPCRLTVSVERKRTSAFLPEATPLRFAHPN